MGNEVKKYALIVNGDTENRHLQNVEQSADALKKEGYEVIVVSSEKPAESCTNYFSATGSNLEAAIQQIAGIMDDNDQFVLYTTGHGGKDGLVLSDGLYGFENLAARMNALNYGKRIIIMDQCFSGNQFSKFANDRTAFIADGSQNEVNNCQSFSPYFFSNDPSLDTNHDRLVTLQERFAHTVSHKTADADSKWFYFNPMPEFDLDGRSVDPKSSAPFPKQVTNVENATELKQQLQRLKPGQLALVTFSTDWCGPCQNYKTTFDELARKYNGQILMLHLEGKEGGESEWTDEFNIHSFPTVAFFDYQGTKMEVDGTYREDPMKGLKAISLLDSFDYQKILDGINNGSPEERLKYIVGLSDKLQYSLGDNHDAFVSRLKEILQDNSNLELQYAAASLLIDLDVFDDDVVTKYMEIFDYDWNEFSQELKIDICESATSLAWHYKNSEMTDENKKLTEKLLLQFTGADGSWTDYKQDPQIKNKLAIALARLGEIDHVSDYVVEILPNLNGNLDQQQLVLDFFKRIGHRPQEFNTAVVKKCTEKLGPGVFVGLLDKGMELSRADMNYTGSSTQFIHLYSGFDIEQALNYIPKLQKIALDGTYQERSSAVHTMGYILNEENIDRLLASNYIKKEKLKHLINAQNSLLTKCTDDEHLFVRTDAIDSIMAMGKYKSKENEKVAMQILEGARDMEHVRDATIYSLIEYKDYPLLEMAIPQVPLDTVLQIALSLPSDVSNDNENPVPENIKEQLRVRLTHELGNTIDVTSKLKISIAILDRLNLDEALPDDVYKSIFTSAKDVPTGLMYEFTELLRSKEIYQLDAFNGCKALLKADEKHLLLGQSALYYMDECIISDPYKFSLDTESIKAIHEELIDSKYTAEAVFDMFEQAEYYDDDTLKSAIRYLDNSDESIRNSAEHYIDLAALKNHGLFDNTILELIAQKSPDYFLRLYPSICEFKKGDPSVKFVPNPFYSKEQEEQFPLDMEMMEMGGPNIPKTVPENLVPILADTKKRQEQKQAGISNVIPDSITVEYRFSTHQYTNEESYTVGKSELYGLPISLNLSGKEAQIEMPYTGTKDEIETLTLCNDTQCVKIDPENIEVRDGRLILKQEASSLEHNPYIHIILNNNSDIKISITLEPAPVPSEQ